MVFSWLENGQRVVGISRLSDRMIVIKVLIQDYNVSIISVYAPQCGISRLSDTMIVIKVLVQDTNVSVVSIYAPECDLVDNQKYHSSDSLISAAGTFWEKQIVIKAVDLLLECIVRCINGMLEVVQKITRTSTAIIVIHQE